MGGSGATNCWLVPLVVTTTARVAYPSFTIRTGHCRPAICPVGKSIHQRPAVFVCGRDGEQSGTPITMHAPATGSVVVASTTRTIRRL